ncbi:hypothetical protein, partial [Haemophilus influenzae]|uniref:hypothetical protein n=1 Tax=Haemophilus influenzae TaxID=727 RepID=UPI0019550270
VDIGGFSAVNAKLNELRKKYKNPLVLHAGDAITGTLYFTLFGASLARAALVKSIANALSAKVADFLDKSIKTPVDKGLI